MATDRGGDSRFSRVFCWRHYRCSGPRCFFAPKSGREMREDLCIRSLELKDDVEQKLEFAVKSAEDILAESRRKLENFRNGAKSGLKDLETCGDRQIY